MASWVTYARPFAKRRAIYRRKVGQRWERLMHATDPDDAVYLEGRLEAAQTAKEAIEWMWADFIAHMQDRP